MAILVCDYLWLLGSSLIHFAEQVFQLWPMSHQLMIHSISFVQKCIDVGNSLDRKRQGRAGCFSMMLFPKYWNC